MLSRSISEENIQHLFAQFVRLRQSQQAPEAAWAAIQKQGGALPNAARHELAVMVQTWEAHYGDQYPSEHGDIHTTTTMSQRPAKIKKLRAQHGEDETTQPLEVDRQLGDEYFPPSASLIMQIKGQQKPLLITIPARGEIIVGRTAPDSILLPEVDLGRVRGHKLGVSRIHASLRRDHNTLLMTDMGSKNFTFLNGKRLLPNEVRVLRHGDEIRFANLLTRVWFDR